MRENVHNKSLCMINKKEFADCVSLLCLDANISLESKRLMFSYLNKINEYQCMNNVVIDEFAVNKDDEITKFLPSQDLITPEKIQNSLNYAIIFTLDKELTSLLSTIYRKIYISGSVSAESIIENYERGKDAVDFIKKNGTFDYVKRENPVIKTDKDVFLISSNLKIEKVNVDALKPTSEVDTMSELTKRLIILSQL